MILSKCNTSNCVTSFEKPKTFITIHFLNNVNTKWSTFETTKSIYFSIIYSLTSKAILWKEIKHVYQPFKENLISDQEIVYNYNSPMLETSLWSNAKWDIHVFFIHYYFDHLLNFKREEKCNVVCKFIVHCHALRKKIGFLIRINGQIPYKIYFSI